MKIRSFIAENTRQAMQMVRDVMGEHAIIIASKKVAEGIEIQAATDQDLAQEVEQAKLTETSLNHPQTPNVTSDMLLNMGKEINTLRDMMQNQLASLAWHEREKQEPIQTMLFKRLMDMGMHPTVSQKISREVTHKQTIDRAWQQVQNILTQNLMITGDKILEEGGFVALVGPTGVGKTTTIAKLAARFILRYGPQEIGLITTDSYRVAAHEQLRVYARILGIPVQVVDDEAGLYQALYQMQDKRLTLIDTAGISQRDLCLTEKLSLFQSAKQRVKSYLVMNATSQRSVLEEVVHSFSLLQLQGAIVTKLDETAQLGPILSVLLQQNLPLAYLTDGQRVPEDLHVARATPFVKQAIEAAHKYQHDFYQPELAFQGAVGATNYASQ